VLLAISSVTGFVGAIIFIYALSKGDVTTANPVLSVRPIFIVPLSFIFLGEFYGFSVIGWILLVVFGAILTSWSEGVNYKNFFKNKAFWLFLSTTFVWSIMSITSKPVLQELDNFNYIAW
jgi:drug/metabolite transporter (DMT)-like permease